MTISEIEFLLLTWIGGFVFGSFLALSDTVRILKDIRDELKNNSDATEVLRRIENELAGSLEEIIRNMLPPEDESPVPGMASNGPEEPEESDA